MWRWSGCWGRYGERERWLLVFDNAEVRPAASPSSRFAPDLIIPTGKCKGLKSSLPLSTERWLSTRSAGWARFHRSSHCATPPSGRPVKPTSPPTAQPDSVPFLARDDPILGRLVIDRQGDRLLESGVPAIGKWAGLPQLLLQYPAAEREECGGGLHGQAARVRLPVNERVHLANHVEQARWFPAA